MGRWLSLYEIIIPTNCKPYLTFIMLEFLSDVLRDYCTLHDLEFMSADYLLYESVNHGEADCFTKLTTEQEDWLSCYIRVWDIIQEEG